MYTKEDCAFGRGGITNDFFTSCNLRESKGGGSSHGICEENVTLFVES